MGRLVITPEMFVPLGLGTVVPSTSNIRFRTAIQHLQPILFSWDVPVGTFSNHDCLCRVSNRTLYRYPRVAFSPWQSEIYYIAESRRPQPTPTGISLLDTPHNIRPFRELGVCQAEDSRLKEFKPQPWILPRVRYRTCKTRCRFILSLYLKVRPRLRRRKQIVFNVDLIMDLSTCHRSKTRVRKPTCVQYTT